MDGLPIRDLPPVTPWHLMPFGRGRPHHHCEPVPIGAAGEIHIGGAGVARGYLNRPELTAERFIASPFVDGDRLYRTGDLGRYRHDGTIEFLGRNDFQVKIRGFRIEPGEIEARLAEHPGVREAVVLPREDAPGDKRLVAYTTTRPDSAPPGAGALRAHLAASLPEYMVPAAYVALDAWPLTANGKLDRQALPAPDSSAFAARGYEPPVGETEERLARIWADVLKLERIGRRDNFFELGGHSLLGIRLMFEIRRAFGKTLAVGVLFSQPTVAGLAHDLERGVEVSEFMSVVPIGTRQAGTPIFMIDLIERDLARHLGRRYSVYGLTFGLAAAGSGQNAHRPQNIENFSTHYIGQMRSVQPRGPYRLIGHSLGGLIAYEMACELAEAGETVEFLGLLDCEAPDPARKPRRLPLARVGLNLARTPPKILLGRLNQQIQGVRSCAGREETVSGATQFPPSIARRAFNPLSAEAVFRTPSVQGRYPRAPDCPRAVATFRGRLAGAGLRGPRCTLSPEGAHGDRQGPARSLDSESERVRPDELA